MACRDLSPKAAPGVDGVTWESCGQDLAASLRDLHARVQQGRYRASPSRRAYIPKRTGGSSRWASPRWRTRIVQRAVVGVLNALYAEVAVALCESCILNCSFSRICL